jgi:hypothetical protein
MGDLFFVQHVLQQDLQCHGMAAPAAANEIIAITLPGPIRVADVMGVVLSIDLYGEILKLKAGAFFGVELGFLVFADHSIVHLLISLKSFD